MPDVFDYTDYREFLRDAISEIKSKKRFFTYRHIAAQVGIKSPGHITWILQGKRNLSNKTLQPFADVLGLEKKSADFFKALVQFNQARTHVDKKFFLDKLVALQKRENKTVHTHQYEFYDKWYYPVIRELVAIHKVKDDYKSLARKIVPHITPQQAEEAVRLLDKLGFIRRNRKGYYEQSNPAITTGEEWKSVAVSQFQMDTFDLGKQALNKTPKQQRDISTLTMSISKDRFETIKQRLKEMRQEIITLVRTDDDPQQVYELNLAFFPLSKHSEEE